ncbi:MAG: nucleotidyltransferase domain-containing protein [Nanoarchaeota archaeon]
MKAIVGQTRQVGNSSGVLLPKEWLNKKVVVTLVEPDEREILRRVIEILYDENILTDSLGIYLIGSHARNKEEVDFESDIDILVITENTNKEIDKDNYQINIISKPMLLKSLKEHPFHHFPMIYEAKTLLNSGLLSVYKNLQIDLKSKFLKDTKKVLKISERRINLDKKLGKEKTGDAVAYSLILRLRALYIIEKIEKKQMWSKKEFLSLIGKITGNLEVYERYLHAKRYESRKDYSIETKDAEKIIKYIKSEMLKWENMKKRREKRG